MTRRTALTLFATSLVRAASRLPANKNVKWALGSNLWNYFPPVPFTDILDIMRDTGFIGVRLTQFPQILEKYKMTIADLERLPTLLGRRGYKAEAIQAILYTNWLRFFRDAWR